ncbi:MAG: hypothetical protein Fur0037_06200 [Planctomycetota bacterium]
MKRGLRRKILWSAAVCLLGPPAAERAFDICSPYPMAKLRGLPLSLEILDARGRTLMVRPTEAGERVLPASWDRVSEALRVAVLTSEDGRFFAHGGVDLLAVGRALLQNVLAGRVVSGASTLTMQCVRIVEPRTRTFASKVVEALRARQLERLLGKKDILDFWLTQVPMGRTLRGLEAASRYWFGKSASDLDEAEAATLVAMIPAPSRRDPARHGDRLLRCRNALLVEMAEASEFDRHRLGELLARPLGAKAHPWPFHAPHLCEVAMREHQTTGPVLRTRADLDAHERILSLIRREDLPGDALAIVVLARSDGSPEVLIGSADFRLSPLDAALRPRSLGSTLKPLLYALGVETGAIGSASRLADVPRTYGTWSPANFHAGHAGSIGADQALAVSSNLPAVSSLDRVGTEAFAELLRDSGLPVDRSGIHLDAALGTSAASPLQLARAYLLFVEHPERLHLSRRSVDWALSAMSRFPPSPGRDPAGRVAWKSGTSSGRRDAWCVGVTRDRVVVVWMGNRDGRGEAGLVGIRRASRLLADVTALLGE